MTVFDFMVKKNGVDTPLKEFEGKVLLIVNTATKCGFTPQYEELEAMYEELKDKGFEILDFPCNQFLGQAPGSNEEIHEFCTMRYKTLFPRFDKINVNGKDEDPLFRFLKDNANENKGKNVKWNFTKFLVDRSGNVVKRFEPTDKPRSFEDEIKALL